MVINQSDGFVLALETIEVAPTVNDFALLLAYAMRRPLIEFAHRPSTLYIRERPEWVELLPHLKQVGIQVEIQDSLPKWDDAFGDFCTQVEETTMQKKKKTAVKKSTQMRRTVSDESNAAFQEIIRVLEGAIQAGVASVGLEYKDRELQVYYFAGNFGIGATCIPKQLIQPVIEQLIKRAGLARKHKGKMPVTLLGKEFEVAVEVYDSFGESAFDLTIKERKKRGSG